MKKMSFVLMGLLLFVSLTAQDYCMTTSVGYGAGVTGGGNATPTIVTSSTELKTALTATGAGVIIIKGNIQVDYLSVLVVNKTILGLPGSSLYTNVQTAGGSGILYFKAGTTNVIMRNVTFVGPGAYDSDGRDGFCLDGASKCWIDHCDFQDGMDGNFDNKGKTDNITISWCKFSYNKPPKAGGSGGTDDHRFTNLVGSSSSDCPTDKQYSITWQYCWWAEGCVERQVRARNAQLHMLNCYWNSSVSKKCIGLEDGSGGIGTQCYVEGSVFEASGKLYDLSYGGSPDITFSDCIGSGLANSSTPAPKPTYSYSAISSSLVKSAVTSSCGAGATLNVTTAGVVSTACSSTTPTPTLSLTSGSTTQSVTVGSAIGSIVYTFGGSATTCATSGLPTGVTATVSTSAKTVTISGTPSTTGTYSYTVTTTPAGASLSGTLTVNSATVVQPTLSLTTGSADQTLTLGSAISSIVYTYGGSGTGATVASLPAGVSAKVNTSAKTVTISGTPAAVGTSTYTVTTTQSSGTAVSKSGTIAVNPASTTTGATETFESLTSTILSTGSDRTQDLTINGLVWAVVTARLNTSAVYAYAGVNSIRLKYATGALITPVLKGSQTVSFYLAAANGNYTPTVAVFKSVDGGATWGSTAILTTSATSTTFNKVSVTISETTNNVKLKILNQGGASASTSYNVFVDDVRFTSASATGTSALPVAAMPTDVDNVDDAEFVCFPTVITSSTEILLPSDDASVITVYDLAGTKVKEQSTNTSKVTLDVADFKAGIYVITVSTNDKVLRQKVVKK